MRINHDRICALFDIRHTTPNVIHSIKVGINLVISLASNDKSGNICPIFSSASTAYR